MNKLTCILALGSVILSAGRCCAEEEEDSAAEEATAETSDETAKKEEEQKFFRTLPFCRRLEGAAEAQLPLTKEWKPVEEGRFYPLGTIIRGVGEKGVAVFSFGTACEVSVGPGSSFGTREQALGEKSRTIVLKNGTIDISLPRNLPAGMFSVAAPGFTAVNLNGDSRFTFRPIGDGDIAVVRCLTGSMAVEGRHFKITDLGAADEVNIRTSQDMLFTGLYGTSGDYNIQLDQGMVEVVDVETKERKVEPKYLQWKMSPRMAVRIHRVKPSIGEKMSVTIMTFQPDGEIVNRCAFTEGRHELNTGEQGEIAIRRIEEASKKAAESTEASIAATTEEAVPEPSAEEPQAEEE